MNLFSGKWHTCCYNSNHVKLALSFQKDARTLFEKETSEDLGKYGYAGYLRVDMFDGGITSPLTVEYMLRRFSEFPEITEVCDGIEAIFTKYDPKFWNYGFSALMSIRSDVNENRARIEYLKSYLPLRDILDILDRPYLNNKLITRKNSCVFTLATVASPLITKS